MARGTVAAELAQTLKSLAGKRCWGVSAGEGTGSVFILSFGWKVPRVRPIANPHHCRDWGTGCNRTRLDYDVFNQLTRCEIACPSIGPVDLADRKT
jgi:hypothetical protein